jgi:hydrogenase maturation protease
VDCVAEGADHGKALIVALGNPLMGDDGAGAAVLERLRQQGADRRARLCELGAAGVDLLIEMEGAHMLVLLDAMVSPDPPGTVRVFEQSEIFAYAESRGGGSHQPSLAETLRMAEKLALLPPRVALVGIAARQFELGAGLSPEVAAAVDQAAEAALHLLDGEPRTSA